MKLEDMFYKFSTYPQLWTKLLTTLKLEDSKRNFCQGFFCENLKIFFVQISTIYFMTNYTIKFTAVDNLCVLLIL